MRRNLVVYVFVALCLACIGSSGPLLYAQKCQRFVKYSGRAWNLSAKNLGPLEFSLGTEAKPIQAASDIVQIFDIYQHFTCQTLRTMTKGTPEYNAMANKQWEATKGLTELMVVLAAYGKDPDATKTDLAKLLTTYYAEARDLQQSTQSRDIKEVNLDKSIKDAQPELLSLLSDVTQLNKSPNVQRTWDLVPKENVEKILAELKAAVNLFAGPLGLEPRQLRASIRMSGGDGYLYRPPGWAVVGDMQETRPSTIRVPLYYGATGVAFTSVRDQIIAIPDKGETVDFRMGDDQEEQRVRAILIDPYAMHEVLDKWVISIPIQYGMGEPKVVAVLNITSEKKVEENKLKGAYESQRGPAKRLAQGIGELIAKK